MLNKSEATKEASGKTIKEINNGSPDFTNRVMGNNFIEFAVTADYVNEFGDDAVISGYWYFTRDEVDKAETLDMLNWADAEDYEVVG